MKIMSPIRLSRKTAVGLIRSVVLVSPQAIEAERQKDREEWARRVGREKAHKFVDQYCEGC